MALHVHLEKELRHLENILPYVAGGPLPFAYWQQRLSALCPGMLTTHQHRYARLLRQLSDLEKSFTVI